MENILSQKITFFAINADWNLQFSAQLIAAKTGHDELDLKIIRKWLKTATFCQKHWNCINTSQIKVQALNLFHKPKFSSPYIFETQWAGLRFVKIRILNIYTICRLQDIGFWKFEFWQILISFTLYFVYFVYILIFRFCIYTCISYICVYILILCIYTNISYCNITNHIISFSLFRETKIQTKKFASLKLKIRIYHYSKKG